MPLHPKVVHQKADGGGNKPLRPHVVLRKENGGGNIPLRPEVALRKADMYPKRDRVILLLENAIDEMDLLGKMSAEILSPDDFVKSLSGITTFRACYHMSMERLMPKASLIL